MENSAGEQFHMGLMWCGSNRSFDIGVCDEQGNEVFVLKLHCRETVVGAGFLEDFFFQVIRLYRKMKSLAELGCCRQGDVEVPISFVQMLEARSPCFDCQVLTMF